MKKLDILIEIEGFDGESILQDDEAITVKTMLCHYLGTHISRDGEESILTRKLGQRIYDHKEDPILLENAEYALILKAIHPPKHTDILYAPFFEAIKDVKDVIIEAKKEEQLIYVKGG